MASVDELGALRQKIESLSDDASDLRSELLCCLDAANPKPPSATAKPRKPAPAAPLQPGATEPAPAPAAAPPSSPAPAAPADPQALCSDRNFIAKAQCMAAQCLKPEYKPHAQCEAVRRQQRIDEEKRNPSLMN